MDKGNELPKRKPTRLKNFDYSSCGAYFVTICIQNRQRILSQIVGDSALDVPFNGAGMNGVHSDVPQIQLTNIGKIVEKYLLSSEKIAGVKIDRYVIMPDHIHTIIFLDPNQYINSGTSRAPSPTNEMLPHVVSTFKRFCNKEIGNNIFQRGYMEHIIRGQEDYITRAKYISENPMRWYYDELYTNE